MHFCRFIILLMSFCVPFLGHEKTNVYLFHGQGSDDRLFNHLRLDSHQFDTIHIHYPRIDRHDNLGEFAIQIIPQINQNTPYIFIGVSFGGMVISELMDSLNPQNAIIVSSAQNQNEIPSSYKMMRYIPIHRIMPAFMYKLGSKIAQPIVEPDRKKEKETFKAMLNAKSPRFLKQVTRLIVSWKKDDFNPDIIHIHGTNDHTLPYKKVHANYTVQNGSHMMMLTQSDEINTLIQQILKDI